MTRKSLTKNRLKQLRAFVSVVEVGSISAAADKLFLSQPAVSLQIKALESELGADLFSRRGPKIEISAAGKVLMGMVLPLLTGVDNIHADFSAKMGCLDTGVVRIAADSSILRYMIPSYIKSFEQKFPHVQVCLHAIKENTCLTVLKKEKVDFVLGCLHDVTEGVEYYPLWFYHLALVVPRGHPLALQEKVTLQDIARYKLILPSEESELGRTVKLLFRQYNIAYKTGVQASDWQVIKGYVALGMGVTIMVDMYVTDEDQHSLIKIPLLDYFTQRSMGAAIKSGSIMSPQARQFLKLLNPDIL